MCAIGTTLFLYSICKVVPLGFNASTAIGFAVAAVFLVLILGLGNMARGGSPNLSQTLMRWRVGLQFAAVLLIIAVLWLHASP